MANKRIKKKKQTQHVTQLFEKAGYTKKEVKRMDTTTRKKEEKRLTKNERERQRVARNRKALEKDGIPLTIIKKERLDRKSYKDLTAKQKSELRRRGEKMAELERLGIKYSQSDLKLGWDKLIDKYGPQVTPPPGHKTRGTAGNKKKPAFNPAIRLTGSTYLYIGAAEVQAGFSAVYFTGISDRELIDMIKRRKEDAKADPSGSADLYCVFQVYSGSRSDCEEIANFYYQRGYNISPDHIKTNPGRYNRITISNSFSQREFHEMVYTCISQMKNEDVPVFMNEMEHFCDKNGLPFMKNLK